MANVTASDSPKHFFLKALSKSWGRIISNFTKGEISYDNQVLLGVILRCGFPSCTLQFGQEENLPGHLIESRAY